MEVKSDSQEVNQDQQPKDGSSESALKSVEIGSELIIKSAEKAVEGDSFASNTIKIVGLKGNVVFATVEGIQDVKEGMSIDDAAVKAVGKITGSLIGGGLGAIGGGGFESVPLSVFLSLKGGEIGGEGFLNAWRHLKNNYAPKTAGLLGGGLIHFDPLVINLDGNGIKLINIDKSNAMFDLTGSGFANKTGWVSSGSAFLVMDRNNNGKIDDISEMFGNNKESGFQALAAYDTNKDEKIDSSDPIFNSLKLWQDKNGDGITENGELISLSDAGIKSISLNTTSTNINQEGNTITDVGSVEFNNGQTTQIADVNFQLNRLYSYYNKDVELNPEIINLPWVKGYGFMPDLPIAMSLDNTLLQMVKDTVSESDLTKLEGEFEKIIFRWAGVENVSDKDIGVSWAILNGDDKVNRLLHFDGGITLSYEQVGALEKFSGMTPEQYNDGIRHASGKNLLDAWNTMFQGLFTRFVVDSGLLKGVLPASYDFFTDSISLDNKFDMNAYNAQIEKMFGSQDINQINLALISVMTLKEANFLDSKFTESLYSELYNNISKISSSPYARFVLTGVIWRTSGDDALYGGDGNDTLIGGPGNDTYVFSNGDGQDTVYIFTLILLIRNW